MDLGGYMRVSRKGDRDPDQWLTVPAQRKAIVRWIEDHGHRLADIREDIDVSGRLDDRPNLEDLVTQVERGELAGIVVAKVDRFSRDLAYGAMIARRIERAGGTFVAADDAVVLSPNGRDFGGNDTAHFLFAQLLSMADFFGRRVTRGWRDTLDRHVYERGRHWGSAVPFGYRKGEDGRLEPDPDWAPLIAKAFERRASGEGGSAIARWLDQEGARTARGGVPTHRWVKDLLANRVYLGEARAGSRVLEGAHPALVDEGLFAAAAGKVGPRLTRREPLADGEGPMLSGLVRCWACRTVMTGGFRTGRRRTYRCRRFHSGGECPAPADVLESELLDLIEPVFWATLGGDLEAQGVGDDSVGDVLAANVERARRALVLYRDSEELADLDVRIYAAGLRTRQERLQSAQVELDQWRRQNSRRIDVAGLREAWPDLPRAARGDLLADVIGAVVVKRPDVVKRGQASPALGRSAVLLVDDLPRDLPRPGRRASEIRAFPPFDDEAVPWVLLGEDASEA